MTPVVPPRGRLFGARDLATYLGITEGRARRVIARGELAAVRNAHGRLEGVYETDAREWQERHRGGSALTAAAARTHDVDERIGKLVTERHW